MKISLILIPLLAFVSACDPISERDCGVFDHPDLAAWQSDTTAGTVQFMSSEGATFNFQREAVVLNEAFRGSDASSNDSDVTCGLTALVRLRSDNDNLAINALYTQLENSKLPSDEEVLRVDHVIESPLGTQLVGGYMADISIDMARVNFNPALVEYLENPEDQEEINGVSYTDVVKISGIDLTPGTDDPRGESINVIKRITIARQFGIVAFTDATDV